MYKVPTVYTATYSYTTIKYIGECVRPHSEALLRHAQSNSPKGREGGAVEPQHRFGTLVQIFSHELSTVSTSAQERLVAWC